MITIIVLWILLGIIVVIVILLHFSLTAQVDLNKKGFELKVRYMFFDIYPRKPKEEKQKRSKEPDLPEDSFDDFEEFEDDIEESLPATQPDDTSENTEEVSESVIEAQPEKISENETEATDEPAKTVSAEKSVDVAEIVDKQCDSSDNDTDNNAEIETEDKPKEITVKQEKKGFAGKLFHKKDKGEKKSASKSKGKKKSKLDELKAQYKKVKPYIPMGWKYFKKLLKAVRFTDTRIVLDVGKEDAYEAAMLYGKVQAGLFNTIAMLAGIFTVKLKKADINCIFDEKKFGYDVHTIVRVRPSTLIAIAFCMGVNFLKIYLSGRRKKKRAAKRRSKELAAKKNEVKATN